MRRLGVCLVLISSAVFADPPAPTAPEQAKRADELFQEGRTLIGKNDYAGACAKFDEAIKIDPTADGIMLNLGLCNEQLGKYKSALYWFRKAQFRATETNLPDNERVAREHTTALATKVATVKLTFSPANANAKVKIDGDVVQPDDYGHAEVDPGHHVLDAGAAGMKNVHQEFDVQGRGGDTLTISFVAGDNTIVKDPGKGRRRAAIFVASGGVALMIASGGLSWYERSIWKDHQMACNNHDPTAIAICNHAHDVAHVYGTGLFVAGSVAVAAAAFLYFTTPAPEVIDQTVWLPTVSPDGVGFAAVGRF